jgi:DNA-binding transcriptional MerR regulator
MAASSAPIEIPNRALFKATEVCELMHLQPYVLRSWEAEFPELGVAKTAGGPRIYRRADLEQVARIKHLLLVEGLTLAGARRKIEADAEPSAEDLPPVDLLISANARQRLTAVKQGLRSILELLTASATARASEFTLTPVASGFTSDRAPSGGPAPRAKASPKPAPSSRPKRSA